MLSGDDSVLSPDVVLELAGTRVVVVGDLMLDKYLRGVVERISPEAPVPVIRTSGEHTVLGGAANVAANVCALGAEAVLMGLYGDDEAGGELRVLCERARVDLDDSLCIAAGQTTVKRRLVSGSQQLLRVDSEEYTPATSELVARVVSRVRFLHAQGNLDALVLSDYAKGTITAEMSRKVIATARSLDVPVIVDPKGVTFDHYSGATVIKPNLTEARRVVSATRDGAEHLPIGDLLRALHDRVHVEHLVVSLAADGLALSSQGATPQVFTSIAVEVSDVSGAGDTLVATVATALGARLPIETAVNLGNTAAGVACGHFGTAVISARELSSHIAVTSRPSESPHIVTDWSRLRALLELRRQSGERVVFANGCFDLLHAGHVSLLDKASCAGEVLVVGLNSDESTRRLKGPTRPLQGLDDRLRVMASVRFVDFVTSFEEDTPLELILAIRPDVIVKGGDYREEDVVGGAEAKEWSGRVLIVESVNGVSTTSLSGGRNALHSTVSTGKR